MTSALKQAMEHLQAKALGDKFPHPLNSTVYKGDPAPKEACGVCLRSAEFLAKMQRERGECSHVDCPHRKKAWGVAQSFPRGGVNPESES